MDMTVGKIMELQRSNDADGEKLSVVSQDGVLNRLTVYQAARNRAVILCMPAMGVRASFLLNRSMVVWMIRSAFWVASPGLLAWGQLHHSRIFAISQW